MEIDWSATLSNPGWWALPISFAALALSAAGLRHSKNSAQAARDSADEAKRANDLTEAQLNAYKPPWHIVSLEAGRVELKNDSDRTLYDVTIAHGADSTRRDEVSPGMTVIEQWDFTRFVGRNSSALGAVEVTYREEGEEDLRTWRK